MVERLIDTMCILVSVAEEQLPRKYFEELDNDGATIIGCLEELKTYRDLEEQGLLLKLPCKVGTKLYRVTYPYRQQPKVTEYTVKNFRTMKNGTKLQLEVQAQGVKAKNYMYFEDFYTTKEEAEAKLKELKNE